MRERINCCPEAACYNDRFFLMLFFPLSSSPTEKRVSFHPAPPYSAIYKKLEAQAQTRLLFPGLKAWRRSLLLPAHLQPLPVAYFLTRDRQAKEALANYSPVMKKEAAASSLCSGLRNPAASGTLQQTFLHEYHKNQVLSPLTGLPRRGASAISADEDEDDTGRSQATDPL